MNITIENIEKNGYKKHHTSLCVGYVKVKSNPVIESYSGRFGNGYIVKTHNDISSRYCYATYYIKEGFKTC